MRMTRVAFDIVLCESRVEKASQYLKDALPALHEKEVEVELDKARLKKYEKKKGKTSNPQKNKKYTRVCNDIKGKIVAKLAEVQREQEEVQYKRTVLEVSKKSAERCTAQLLDKIKNFSVEKWIILTKFGDLLCLSKMQSLLGEKELYFSLGGSIDGELRDRLGYIARDALDIKILNPSTLYLLKNEEFTTVSLEKEAELGFQTFSRRGL